MMRKLVTLLLVVAVLVVVMLVVRSFDWPGIFRSMHRR